MADSSVSSTPFLITPDLMAEVWRRTQRPTSPAVFYYFAIGCCIAAALAGHYLAPNSMPIQVLVGALAVLAIIYLTGAVQRARYRWQIQRAPALQHNLTVTVDETGVRSKTEVSENWIAWSAIHSVQQTPAAVLIFTQPGSAYPVPKSAFADADEAARFATNALSYWLAARSK